MNLFQFDGLKSERSELNNCKNFRSTQLTESENLNFENW